MFGNRIQRARKAQGLSLRELAGKIGLSHAAIKKYEDNQTIPSSTILIKLAKALHVKVEYFFRPTHFELNNIQYRHLADMPSNHKIEIEAKIFDNVERRIELESLFPSFLIANYSQPKLPELQSEQEIEALADNIRKQWNLGLDPIPDLIDACENQGIKVFRFDNSHYPKFDGLAAFINNNIPVIVISSPWPGDRQRFTLAHELGHLLLAGQLANHLDEEKCCNRFAGAFLLPKKSLLQILGNHRNYIEPRELSILKEEFGISMLSILHRIEDAGIISNKLYSQLRSQFNAHGWDKKEPGNPYPEEITNSFEQMVFHALAENFIGESKAAELMNISIESFRALRTMENATCHY